MKSNAFLILILIMFFNILSFGQTDVQTDDEVQEFIIVSGFVLDNASHSGLNSQILIKNAETFKIVSIVPTDNASGSFTLKLKKAPYYFVIEARGYKLYNELVDLTNSEEDRIQKDLLLIPSDLNVPTKSSNVTKSANKTILVEGTNTSSDPNSPLYTKSTKSSDKSELLTKYEVKEEKEKAQKTKPKTTGKRYDQMVLDDSIHVEIVHGDEEVDNDKVIKTKLAVARKIPGQVEEQKVRKSENAINVASRDEGKDNSFNFSLKQGFQFIDVVTSYDEGEVRMLDNNFMYDKVIEFLAQNEEIQIEIRGYADDGLSNDYQKEIAIRRAKDVENYFIVNGIDEKRISAIAFPTSEIELFIRTKRLWRQKHLIEFRILGDSLEEYDFKIRNSLDYELAYSISLPEDQIIDEKELEIKNPSSIPVPLNETEEALVDEIDLSNIIDEKIAKEASSIAVEESKEEVAVNESAEVEAPKEEETVVPVEEMTEYDRMIAEELTIENQVLPSSDEEKVMEEASSLEYEEEKIMRTPGQEGDDEIVLDIEIEDNIENADLETSQPVDEAVVEEASSVTTEELNTTTTSDNNEEEVIETEEERVMRLKGQKGVDEIVLDLPGFETPEEEVTETVQGAPKEIVEEEVVAAPAKVVVEEPIDAEVDLSEIIKEQEEVTAEINEDDFKTEKKELDGDKIISAYEKLLAQTDEINAKVIFFEKKKKDINDKFTKAMDSIVHYLDAHPKVKINIVGYSSKKDGKSEASLLAKARAQEVANYFIDEQIDKKRLKIKGGGLFNRTGKKMDPSLEQRVVFEIIPVKIPSGKSKPRVSASKGAPPKLKSRGTSPSSKGVKSVSNYDDADDYESLRTVEKVETAKKGEYSTKPKDFPKLKTDDDYYDYLVENENDIVLKGLSYRIQVGAYRLPLDKEARLFKLVKDAELEDQGDGWYRYFSGNFNNIVTAEKSMSKIRKKKMSDAFVAAFYNGKKIPMRKATEMLLRSIENK